MGIKQVQINTKSLKFGLVGMVNTLVDYTILNLLVFSLGVFAPAALVFCNVFSFLGANINSYVMNKRWTFEDRSGWSQNEYLVFLLCSLGGLGINCGVIFLLSYGFFDPEASFFIHLNLSKLAATVASMIWNFLSYKAFVFNRRVTVETLPDVDRHERSAQVTRG